MRIGVISTTIFQIPVPGYAGLEVIAEHCARGLARKGHEVFLFAPDGSHADGVTIVPFGPAGQVDEKMAYSGFPEQKNHQGQVVRRKHEGYWPALLQLDCIVDHSWHKFAYMMKMERLKAPVLGVMHAPVNTMIGSLPPGIDKPCFVCISKNAADHFEALFEHPARVCYNGFDIGQYQSMNIPRTDRFLFLARYSSVKGPDLAIRACLDAGVGLDLIGDTTITQEPDYFRECMQLSERTSPGWDKSKGKQIRVHGGCPRGEAVYWYSQAHCMLHPNQRFREPFGLAPLEAMSCGCPVIAWNRGAMKETVGEESLVNTYDELVNRVRALSGPISDTIRNSVRHKASKFSLEAMVDRYDELCYEAVEGGW